MENFLMFGLIGIVMMALSCYFILLGNPAGLFLMFAGMFSMYVAVTTTDL